MSKFYELDHFVSEGSKYELLPFRFETLSEEEVVVTNAVGEFTYLSRKKLNDLVGHKLPTTDPDYIELRSRHFIQEEGDKASLELLALKTRTKLSNLSNFTNLHLFVV